jgi:hypothetical protein
MVTRPIMNKISGWIKILISAGTNWKGSKIDERKTDIFSPPKNRNKNNVNIKRDVAIRILTRFNECGPYIA